MATFAIETDFVIPSGNTLPTNTSTTTSDLAAGQFGVYLPNYVPATAITAASAKYVYLAQGRPIYAPGEGTKRSDKIYAKNLISWFKMAGQSTNTPQITTFSDLATAKCNDDIHVTLRLDSYYIRTAYFNGLTRSVMTTMPCCDCGGSPCDTVADADVQAAMEDLADKINADTILNKFVTASNTGSGASTALVITAKALDQFGNACDLTAFPFMWDRLSFWTFVHKGPDQTSDYEVVDRCDDLGTITVTQRASLPVLSSDEVTQIEKDNFSYQAVYKHIFSSPLYNGEYASLVAAGTTYDLYYLKFKHEDDFGFSFKEQIDESVALYVPHGQTAGLEAILVAAFGSPVDITSTHPSSNTSTVVP